MLKFKFDEKERLIVDYKILLFKEFTNILSWDRTKDKVKANQLFRFIFFLADLSDTNPIRFEQDKEAKAMFQAFKTRDKKFTDKEYQLLSDALLLYIKVNSVAEERLLETFDKKAEEIRDILNITIPETNTNIKDGVVSFVTNSDIISRGLKELVNLEKVKESIIAVIKKDSISNKVRGNIKLSPNSKGLLYGEDRNV